MGNLKIVQEYLFKLDKEKIISEYLNVYPINYEKFVKKNDLSVREIREEFKKKLEEYIVRLQNLEIISSENGEEYILFAHKILKEGFEEATYSLISLQEFVQKGNDVQTYAYEFCKQEEIMGYMVSNAEYTQENIYELIVDVLYEASFFGFEQEVLEEEQKKLEDSIKEIEEGKASTYPLEEIKKMFGLKEEEKDEIEEKLQDEVMKAVLAYEKYCRDKELNELRKFL